MTLETIIHTATAAGFQVDTLYPYVIISLTNRIVSTLEVAVALNIPQAMCQASNGAVLVTV